MSSILFSFDLQFHLIFCDISVTNKIVFMGGLEEVQLAFGMIMGPIYCHFTDGLVLWLSASWPVLSGKSPI